MEINDNGGGGGGTDFRSMSHEQMLAWLDQASSFYVQQAADKLSSAAGEMREIAQQLRFRPERVNWKGETPDALVEWGDSLAKSTFALADYSDNASKWMAEASNAIATAQSSIPRYTSNAQAKENLEAARKYHNDPDSQTVARNAQASMAETDDAKAIAAKEEANRQAAAAEMEKLSQAYSWSQYQMDNGAKTPTFPPPPEQYKPDSVGDRDTSRNISYSTSSEGHATADSSTTTTTTRDGRSSSDTGLVSPPSADRTGPVHVVRPEVPADLGIDTVGTLPPPTATTPSPAVQPPITRPDTGMTPPSLTIPPGPGVLPPTMGKGVPGTTPPISGTRTPLGPNGRSPIGTTGPLQSIPREGISGGRAVPQTSGRPTTGLPRGMVVGQEPTGNGRTPMGRSMGGPMGHGPGGTGPVGGGQSGISGGRRLAMESGGIVGGRPQQPGAAGSRPFTPGGSGLVRGGAAGEAAAKSGQQIGRGGMPHGAAHGAGMRNEESKGERPDYLVEDEETWQQGGRRVAPPVID